MKLAVASSALGDLSVQIAKKSLHLLEVIPGVSVASVLSSSGGGFEDEQNLQIGRSDPLSSDKAKTHFPILREKTGISYDEMLYFDDCNWDDHCTRVMTLCPGVVALATPHGLRFEDFEEGLARFAKKITKC
jgi:magnesium-dependent phosphatase 1